MAAGVKAPLKGKLIICLSTRIIAINCARGNRAMLFVAAAIVDVVVGEFT